MANLLNKNNKHLFLEKPDKSPNSFVENMNSLAKSFRGLTSEEVLALKDIPATIVSLGEEWKLVLEETALDLLAGASAFNTAIVTKITEDVPANSEIVLPDIAKYVVGTNMLMLSYNGTVCYLGEQFEEIGEPHTDSDKIRILFDLRTDDVLEFRIVALNANVSNSAVIAKGSTEPRALSERFSDIVNVKDFGAKGDGITDDTAAIQTALEVSIGKTLFFPDGVYIISDELSIGENSGMLGDSTSIIKKQAGRDGSGVFRNSLGLPTDNSVDNYDGNSNIVITNLIFEGEFYNSNGVEYGIAFFNCHNIVVQDCEFRYWNHGHLVEFSGVKNGQIVNCHFHHLKYSPDAVADGTLHLNEIIQLDPCTETSSPAPKISSCKGTPNKNILIKNCVIGDDKDDTLGIGIGTYSSRDTIIMEDITISNCRISNAQIGININRYKNVNISGCNIKANEYAFNIFCGDVETADNFNISGNTAVSSNSIIKYDANVTEGKRNNKHVITGNTFEGSVGSISYIQDISGVILSNNIIHGNVLKMSGCVDAIVSGNVLEYISSSTDTYMGALYFGNSSKNSCDKCVCSNNVFRNGYNITCIRASDVPTVSITGNLFVDWMYSGDLTVVPIRLTGTTNAFIQGNCSKNIPNEEFLCYGDSTCKIIDGGNYAESGHSSSQGVIDDTKLVQLSGVLFHNFSNKGSHNDIIYGIDSSTSQGVLRVATLDTDGTISTVFYFNRTGSLVPQNDNKIPLGLSYGRWSQIYAGTGTINTSDAREKTFVTDPDEALMRAWSKVDFKSFKFCDAVEKKGEDARIHFGVVAQQVAEAFTSEGLDASKYALFCHDKWEDEWEEFEVVDKEEVVDSETGEILKPRQTHTEKRLICKAGDRYGIRYSEALALECAYQRWLGEKREQRIAALEAKLGETNV